MDTRFLRRVAELACLGFLFGASIFPAAAQAPAAAQEGPKLYVFTSGSLGGFPKAALQIGGTGNIDWAPVSFYVIKHPKGNVMFDTGNNDKTITDADGWWGPLAKGFGLKMTKDDAIPVQLAKIGLKPDDIKYVAVGHLHLDHGGNVGQFKNSTLIAQDDEFKAAWWPDVGFSLYYIPGDFAETKNMKTIRLNGDEHFLVDMPHGAESIGMIHLFDGLRIAVGRIVIGSR